MAVDLQRVAKAALDAALQQPTEQADGSKPRPRISGGKAFLFGAGLATAARLIASPRSREMVESIQQRIEGSDWFHEDEEPDDQEDFEDEDYDEEPEGEADEDAVAEEDDGAELEDGDFEDEQYDEQPEGEAEEDFDEEEFDEEGPEAEEDEDLDDEEVEEERPARPRRRVKARGRG